MPFKEISDFEVLYGQPIDGDTAAMEVALALANHAASLGEVPVGAVVVCENRLVGLGFNCPITTIDPSAHAEVRAIRDAASRLGNYRLNQCQLFVTIEPCTMCTGLLLHARIARLVYGALEPKAGAVCSASQVPTQPWVNHHMQVEGGVLAQQCSELMTAFFSQRRAAKKALKRQLSSAQEVAATPYQQ